MIGVSILAPFIAAILVYILRERAESTADGRRNALIAILATVVSLVSAAFMQRRFAGNYAESQLREVWWTSGGSGVNVVFAVDGLSMPLFLSACLLFFIAAIFSLNTFNLQRPGKTRTFWTMFLLLESIVLGVFSAYNFIVFFALWELFLIPLVVLMWRYGLEDRQKAATNFFIYTFVSSAFMIAAFAAIVYYVPRVGGDFDLRSVFISEMPHLQPEKQRLLFLFFMAAFLVKMPVFPFHAWLPLTHTQAPIGTLLLSGLFLKLGSYGVLRFVTPNFNGVLIEWGGIFLYLGIVSMFYGAFAAFRQKSFRYVIAYSSLAHMGLILSGSLSQQENAVAGAMIQNVGHSLANALLFMIVCMHLARNKTDALDQIRAPASFVYWAAFSIAMFSAIGVPGTIGFLGEVLILYGLSFKSWLIVAFATLTLVTSAIYMLRLFHKVRANEADTSWHPNLIEKFSMIALSATIIWFGIFPSFLATYAQTTARLLSQGVTGVLR
ncbi:MAG: NADH-quinone oxidoreductase subunit M [Turneriella sp.]